MDGGYVPLSIKEAPRFLVPGKGSFARGSGVNAVPDDSATGR
jgi:hypothetical protein